MEYGLFDSLPLWIIFLFTVGMVLISIEVGFRIGLVSRDTSIAEEISIEAIVTTSLGLLAFILAFTFSMAEERFNNRRTMILEEATSIDTAYLRSELLPEPNKQTIQNLIHKYSGDALEGLIHPEKLFELSKKTNVIQEQIWKESVAVMDKTSGSRASMMFVYSINDMFDRRSKRISFAFNHRIPNSILITLSVVTILAMIVLGYQTGLSGSRKILPAFFLGLAFSSVILLIANLDSPLKTASKINQQPMIEIEEKLHKLLSETY